MVEARPVPTGSSVGRLDWVRRAGQSLWLDNLDRAELRNGTLARWVEDLGLSGLTSNPSILARALTEGQTHDGSLMIFLGRGVADPQELVYSVALEDVLEAASLFLPIHQQSRRRDGYVSLEIPPDLAHDYQGTLDWGRRLFERAGIPNLLIKVPGTTAGLAAAEELMAGGVGVNLTLLFSEAHYLEAVGAHLRALERRRAAGLPLDVPSVASVFVSRWDVAAGLELPERLHHRLGLAVARRTLAAYRKVLKGRRWAELEALGALPQRLLWASTSTKDPRLPATYYAAALVAEGTIDTMPEVTLQALAAGPEGGPMDEEVSEADRVIGEVRARGLHVEALGDSLQAEGVERFARDWKALLAAVENKAVRLRSSLA
ncbi:MAG: transaldolase family protein [Candidatus Dormibacteria bacterium]